MYPFLQSLAATRPSLSGSACRSFPSRGVALCVLPCLLLFPSIVCSGSVHGECQGFSPYGRVLSAWLCTTLLSHRLLLEGLFSASAGGAHAAVSISVHILFEHLLEFWGVHIWECISGS